ncbi:MAG: short chain dehydrogenase [Acidobacteria bacterium]|nr:short chain dehydrogenase [Acidobacteriota bacterium]
MRVLIIGATGTVGSAVAAALGARHDLVLASLQRAPERVDITDAASLRALFARVGRVDAIVSAAGRAAWKPLTELADDDFQLSLSHKLMGQVNVVRIGIESVADRGSITLTAGFLSRFPAPGSAAVSLVNSALEGFGRAAALEAPRGIRVNVVSPPWLTETLQKLGRPLTGGIPAAQAARSYVRSVEGSETGQVFDPREP